MKTQKLLTSAAIAALITSASASVTIEWVTVGNAGNAPDPLTGFGAVAYEYKIGKYEVTNAQYGAFLNAKGKSNANGVYNSNMSSYGITQTGSSGSYSYTVTGALANRPVVYVSWFDAARFANWMMNGQGNGDMESGAYTLNGATSGIITANIGAQVYLPSRNEWYKAAYANYDSSASTNVGTYINDPSSYGTFDQGGNVAEWNDTIFADRDNHRFVLGGAWNEASNNRMLSASKDDHPLEYEYFDAGFRLASAVPEPTSLLLTALASCMMLIRRKR
jgi:formylglycine-generating enzyme required for sulfatase activity